MKRTLLVIAVLALAMLVPPGAAAKDKKKPPRGMIESMQSVPCGMKEKGLIGLGAVWGSVGVTSVSSNEKLCPQYLFRTDDLEYHLRPTDTKHPVILPIGREAEFKIHKDKMFLKVPDGDKKTRTYHVVSMEPVRTARAEDDAAFRPSRSPQSPAVDPANATAKPTQNSPAVPPPQHTASQSTMATPQLAPPQH